MKILDDETIDAIIRSSRIKNTNLVEQKKEQQTVKTISVSVTSLHNAFNMIKTYSENILNLQNAISLTKKKSVKENTVENFYETPVNNSAAFKELPSVIRSLITLSKKLDGAKLVSEQSVLSNISSSISSFGIAAVLGIGAAGYAGYEYLSDDEPEPEYEPPVEKAPTEKPEPYRPPTRPTVQATPNNESNTERNTSNRPILAGSAAVSLAERMRRLIRPANRTAGDFKEGAQEGWQHVDPVEGNEATSKAMQYFQQQGWTKQQAAGIVGNLQVESGNFAPDVVAGTRRGDNGKAVGIAQWHPDRQASFRRVFGRSIVGAPLEQQLAFIQYELTHTEKKAGERLRNTTEAEEAAQVIDQLYERSNGRSLAQRQANARALAGSENLAYSGGRWTGGMARFSLDVINNTLNKADDNNLAVPGNIRQYVTLNGNVNLQGVHPTVMRRFAAMAVEYFNKTGDKLHVNSAFRTYAEQAALFNKYGPGRAARPGHSRHESGLAIDIQSGQANDLNKMGLLSKYNFHRPVYGEAWHLEPVEGRQIPRTEVIEENMGSDQVVASAVRQASSARSGQLPAMSMQNQIRRRQQPRIQDASSFRSLIQGNGPVAPARLNIANPGQNTTRPSSPTSSSMYRSYFTR